MSWKRLAVVLPALMVVACSSDLLSVQEAQQLALAEEKWDSRGFGPYRFEVRRLCFCSPDFTAWAEVQVVNDAVVGVRLVDTGTDIDPSRYSAWPTIDQLFREIHHLGGGESTVEVTLRFDPQLGFPRVIEVQPNPPIPDAGFRTEVRSAGPLAIP